MSGATSNRAARAVPWRRYRFTDAEFDRMIRAGVLRPDARAFLWNGEVVEPMAEDQPHLRVVSCLFALLLSRFVEADWAVMVNQPVQVRPRYRPQPDLCVLNGPADAWAERGRVPGPADVALLVEIADSSDGADSGPKLRRHAAAGIAPYWIVNLRERRIEVHAGPVAGESRYERVVPLIVARGDRPLVLETIPVRQVLRGLLG